MKLDQVAAHLRQGSENARQSPARVDVEMHVLEGFPPAFLDHLACLERLGILNGDVIISVVAQAPLDPLGLVRLLKSRSPEGWAFSTLDCSLVRVIGRDAHGRVAAAVRVGLLDNVVETTVAGADGQIVTHQRFDPVAECETRLPGLWIVDKVQDLCDVAVKAALSNGLAG